MSRAAALLGRLFDVEGPVFQGDQRGRDLGFPTANIRTQSDLLLPANGIYACWVWRNGERLPAVTNVGVRPTFGEGNQRWVEAHVLDFDERLYDETLRVEFIEMLRPEARFESVEALVEQMHRDVAETRRVLAEAGR
jgi:riboflavin kinase/FMN adenylyltransferase